MTKEQSRDNNFTSRASSPHIAKAIKTENYVAASDTAADGPFVSSNAQHALYTDCSPVPNTTQEIVETVDIEKDAKMKRLKFLLTKAEKFSEWLGNKMANEPIRPAPVPKVASDTSIKGKKGRKSSSSSESSATVSLKNDMSIGLKGCDTPLYTPMEPLEGITSRQPPGITGAVMRDYQITGMEWLISLYENGINGILADEMGLGKTLQTIAFLSYLRSHGIWGPILIVAPLSTLSNWVSEVKKFAPDIPVLMYHGNQQERQVLRRKHMSQVNPTLPWIITSYEITMNDRKYLQNYSWKYIVIDEGHRIKNLDCKLVRELKSYTSANRLLLTGTPLQNNLKELWALLNFLMPDIFSEIGDFMEWFNFESDLASADKILNNEQENSIVSNLHNILKPFLLRRIKSDVAKDLPRKIEFIVYCPLVEAQKKLYTSALKGCTGFRNDIMTDGAQQERAVLGKRKRSEITYEQLSDDAYFETLEIRSPEQQNESVVKDMKSKGVNQLKLQNITTQLRKVCNHPLLFYIPTETLEADDDTVALGHWNGVKPIYNNPIENVPISTLPELVHASGKMLMLERLLPALLKRGHKVLIFSQMTKVLDILCDYLEMKIWPFCRIDGNVGMTERQAQIKAFQEGDVRIFLLSTRSGGLGINLTAADTVIIYDSDWNPQMDLQAQDRCHRIGQTKPVNIYRFITENSVEQHILSKATQKRKLERLVIHKNQFKGSSQYYSAYKKLDLDDLRDLLIFEEQRSVSDEKKHVNVEDVMDDEHLEALLGRQDIIEGTWKRFTVLGESRDEKNDMLVGI